MMKKKKKNGKSRKKEEGDEEKETKIKGKKLKTELESRNFS